MDGWMVGWMNDGCIIKWMPMDAMEFTYIRGMKWMLYKMDLQVGLHTRRGQRMHKKGM
jgi:hypothetical protein